MKRTLALAAALTVAGLSTAVAADDVAFIDPSPTVSFGLTIPLGGGGLKDFGLSLNLLSSNEQDAWVAGGGVTFYPGRDNRLGCSVIGGRNFTNYETHLGYDFCQEVFTFGVGGLSTISNMPL